MNIEAKNNEILPGRLSTGGRIKNILSIIIIATMFATGFYSLFLAATYAGTNQEFTTDNLFRTAAPSDTDKIETALGHFSGQDFIFVIVDTSMPNINPNLEFSAGIAARALADSGLTTAVRFLYPDDNDFTTIVAQNDIRRFPVVLAVKKEGGIIRIMDDHSQEYLLFAYHSIWGKSSDCSDSKSAVY
jgi:hypothetical protein